MSDTALQPLGITARQLMGKARRMARVEPHWSALVRRGWMEEDILSEVVLAVLTRQSGRSKYDPTRGRTVDSYVRLVARSRMLHLLERRTPPTPGIRGCVGLEDMAPGAPDYPWVKPATTEPSRSWERRKARRGARREALHGASQGAPGAALRVIEAGGGTEPLPPPLSRAHGPENPGTNDPESGDAA